MSNIIDNVKEYYGKQLQNKSDLITGACCAADRPPAEIREVLPLIADEILDRFYGCGSPLPPMLDGMTVLDMGCGTGRDVYIASKLVGEAGCAIGVDMTTEQIETAMKYQDEQREQFGYNTSNVMFYQGYIEDLKSLGIEDKTVDVVISNCVINLSPARFQVSSEIRRSVPRGLLSDSIRLARFTGSPITVYSIRFSEPSCPAVTIPVLRPEPIQISGLPGSSFTRCLFSSYRAFLIMRAALTPLKASAAALPAVDAVPQ